VTRPEPTIYGNCDSWNFIVGKKPGAYSRKSRQNRSLQVSNRKFTHRLSTYLKRQLWDKLWAICGSSPKAWNWLHPGVKPAGHIRPGPTEAARFYRNEQL